MRNIFGDEVQLKSEAELKAPVGNKVEEAKVEKVNMPEVSFKLTPLRRDKAPEPALPAPKVKFPSLDPKFLAEHIMEAKDSLMKGKEQALNASKEVADYLSKSSIAPRPSTAETETSSLNSSPSVRSDISSPRKAFVVTRESFEHTKSFSSTTSFAPSPPEKSKGNIPSPKKEFIVTREVFEHTQVSSSTTSFTPAPPTNSRGSKPSVRGR